MFKQVDLDIFKVVIYKYRAVYLCRHIVIVIKCLTTHTIKQVPCLPFLGCFVQTLQLVVHNEVLSQRAVNDLLAICRKIVGYFKHSSLAYSRLCEIQNNLSLPPHRLKQDEPTRWNLTLYVPYSTKFWRHKTLANQSFRSFGEENVGEFTIANVSYFSESGIWLLSLAAECYKGS